MGENHICFKTCFLSDAGVFVKDKGAFAYKQLDNFAFWIVADGLEFNEEKESAQLVVEQLFDDLIRNPTMQRNQLKKYLTNAHNLLLRESAHYALKASLILLVTDYSSIIWAVSGNSRMYHFRDREFTFRSQDQSNAEQLVQAGNLSEYGTPRESEPYYLTDYMGISNAFAPFISKKYKLHDGDVMLLCNSGFWEKVRYDEMSQALKLVSEPMDYLTYLKELLQKKESRILNNYVIGAVFADRVLQKPHCNYQKNLPRIAVAALGALLLIGGITFGYWTMENIRLKKEAQAAKMYELSQRQLITDNEKKGDALVVRDDYINAAMEYNKAINILLTFPDPQKESEIRAKHRIVLLINEGDSLREAQNYQSALEKYQCAQDMVGGELVKAGLAKRIEGVNGKMKPKVIAKKAVPVTPSQSGLKKNKATLWWNHVFSGDGEGATGSGTSDKTNKTEKTDKDNPDKSEKTAEPSITESQALQQERAGDKYNEAQKYDQAYAAYKKALKICKKLKLAERSKVIKEKMKVVRSKQYEEFSGGD